jgi:hypothetical protein
MGRAAGFEPDLAKLAELPRFHWSVLALKRRFYFIGELRCRPLLKEHSLIRKAVYNMRCLCIAPLGFHTRCQGRGPRNTNRRQRPPPPKSPSNAFWPQLFFSFKAYGSKYRFRYLASILLVTYVCRRESQQFNMKVNRFLTFCHLQHKWYPLKIWNKCF